MALWSTEAEYIALTLAAKKVTWLYLLLTKLSFLHPDQHYALIKVSENNKTAHTIHQDLEFKEEREHESESKDDEHLIVIPLKGNNQSFIALALNPVFLSKTKHIDI